jgi:hypothetical protein
VITGTGIPLVCERFTENLVLKKTQGKKENELP